MCVCVSEREAGLRFNKILYCDHIYNITLIQLTDALKKCKMQSVYTFDQFMHSLGIKPRTLALLASCFEHNILNTCLWNYRKNAKTLLNMKLELSVGGSKSRSWWVIESFIQPIHSGTNQGTVFMNPYIIPNTDLFSDQIPLLWDVQFHYFNVLKHFVLVLQTFIILQTLWERYFWMFSETSTNIQKMLHECQTEMFRK